MLFRFFGVNEKCKWAESVNGLELGLGLRVRARG